MTEPKHTYPSRHPRGSHWSTDAAWEILDHLKPGVLPDDIRAYLAGAIGGLLMRYTMDGSAVSPQGDGDDNDIVSRLTDHGLYNKQDRMKLFIEARDEIVRLRAGTALTPQDGKPYRDAFDQPTSVEPFGELSRVLDQQSAHEAADAICDYADQNLTKWDAYSDETPQGARDLFEAAKRLRDMLNPSLPRAEQGGSK